ncbi:MAG: hypothetical protein N0E59_05255 [Candidatus Thiodiazotropha taylori]|nr:hypothetical protein [Candidatus Thiodiazotropha taylori]MCG8093298.1 hypothetical protein [Candidatus Thiodiazotropha endolucinida]MCG8108123.1 hypothetical protein [Candidatus Thiodiazotropha taylori]MCG8110151.1 hypothetical protein [Candidatus Thiodiazotropha taylori]MCW4280462.1 hypothetical protein [Candidatus Thiodiazotropha taylori]
MNSIAILGLRIISIYQIVTGINAIAGLSIALPVVNTNFNEDLSILQLLSIAIPLVSGIAIWFLSVPISKYVIDNKGAEVKLIDDVNIVSAGTFLIGVYMVFSQLPTFYFVIVKYYELEYGMDSTSLITAIKLSSISLVIGLLLMTGYRFFVDVYKWLRRAG